MKLVYGVGVNDLETLTCKREKVNGLWKTVWQCPYYKRWSKILRRSFSEKYKQEQPAYKDVTCCEEWLLFSNFKSWMEKQDWVDKDLDKDLLIFGNSTYSPEACCFVTKEVNGFMVKSDTGSSSLPIGVHRKSSTENCIRKKQYAAEVCIGSGRKKHLGCYVDPMEAHRMWQLGKIEYAKELISKETNPRVVTGLKRVIEKIQSDYDNCLETTDF